MGIKHLSDLNVDKFIEVIRHLNEFLVTEKIDGYALNFGKESGVFYSSRYRKIYKSSADYPSTPRYNAFRNAHNIIQQHTQHISDDFHITCEILHGNRPNAIAYGTNQIILLDSEAPICFNNVTLSHTDTVYNSTDGKTYSEHQCDNIWILSNNPSFTIPIEIIDSVLPLLYQFEQWLHSFDQSSSLSRKDILTLNLTTIKISDRARFKNIREKLRIEEQQYKQNIINYILSQLDKKHFSNSSNNEIVSIEGIVTHTPYGIFKLVNKDTFSAINQFHYATYNKLRKKTRSSKIKPTGLYDRLIFDIGTILKITNEFQIDYDKANKINITPNQVKPIQDTIIRYITELDSFWQQYSHEYQSYHIIIQDTPYYLPSEVHQRNINMFAELHQHLQYIHQLLTDENYDLFISAFLFSY